MEAIQKDIPTTASRLRQVRMGSNSRGPHHTSESGRQLLGWAISTHVQVMPQPQERTRASWYEEVTWTWGDYYDELTYISYDYEVV